MDYKQTTELLNSYVIIRHRKGFTNLLSRRKEDNVLTFMGMHPTALFNSEEEAIKELHDLKEWDNESRFMYSKASIFSLAMFTLQIEDAETAFKHLVQPNIGGSNPQQIGKWLIVQPTVTYLQNVETFMGMGGQFIFQDIIRL